MMYNVVMAAAEKFVGHSFILPSSCSRFALCVPIVKERGERDTIFDPTGCLFRRDTSRGLSTHSLLANKPLKITQSKQKRSKKNHLPHWINYTY